jgi:hypothetical protein
MDVIEMPTEIGFIADLVLVRDSYLAPAALLPHR